MAAKGRDGHHALEPHGIRRESNGPALETRIVQVCSHRSVAEPEAFIDVRRHVVIRLILEDEVAKAVEDRLALVYLDPSKLVWTMDDVSVRAGIDALLYEFNEKRRRLKSFVARIVGMTGNDDEIRLPDRVSYRAENSIFVARVDLFDYPCFATRNKGVASES